MAEYLRGIEAHREAILLGEIGALLHMVGKCSSEFLIANSNEGGEADSHQHMKHVPALQAPLSNGLLTDRFAFTLNGMKVGLSGSFSDFITKYKGNQPDCDLLRLFNTCHRMNSADEKGVVRRKQARDDMWIATPFGHRAEKIDLARLDDTRLKADKLLAEAFEAYLSQRKGIEWLRDGAVGILKPHLSHALGETREPANDVTLWAQSHGVAALFKPVLATLALGVDPCTRRAGGNLDCDNVRWRLLGVGWNGLGFVERGRRPGDILRRQELIGDICREVQRLLEITYPVGNRFYADVNGLFFTFPALPAAEATELAKELGPTVVQIVRERSADELWPFFTLSKDRRTLTAITREIEARDGVAAMPKVAALLSMEADGGRQEQVLIRGPALTVATATQDVCPVCQDRSKAAHDESCQVCRNRRADRQRLWQQNRTQQTIWLDEVADENGRIALMTVRLDLSGWLNGRWLTTVWSQTLGEWAKGKRVASNRLDQLVSKGEITRPNGDRYDAAKSFAKWVVTNPERTECKPVIEAFLEEGGGSYEVGQVPQLLEDISDAYGARDADALLKHFFTQNPSPARLTRIWEEIETSLNLWLDQVAKESVVRHRERVAFSVATSVPGTVEGGTYQALVPQLAPGRIAVLCLDGRAQSFLSIDSLERFRFTQDSIELRGVAGVQAALREVGVASWRDDLTGRSLPGVPSATVVRANSSETEPYVPMIALARSPVYCQVLLPANRAPAALRSLLALMRDRFGLVEGKLPIHVSLLAAKRKSPLYALIEAGEQMLHHADFNKERPHCPWWRTDTHRTNDFFGQYLRGDAAGGLFSFSSLAPVDDAQAFLLTPGYFDFEFLGASADRYRLTYEANANTVPIRASVAYGPLRPRPLPLHQVESLLTIWHTLTANLGSTQRHYLAEALSSKLEEWRAVGDAATPVIKGFAEALVKRCFGSRWAALEPERKELLMHSVVDGRLLEALELFQHVLKEDGADE
jgi:CRISPR-associated Csx11 family protein